VVAAADVVLVPALAVDPAGNRLGRGGGSYDRALARARADAALVAVLHDGEMVERVPVQPHDIPVGAALLPGGCWSSAHGRSRHGVAGPPSGDPDVMPSDADARR
jgi:5-formyltetrahydrofolate cyclo-ligase